MSYQDTDLNGWDYVFAITQKQVNNGLKILFNSGQLPKSFTKQETILGMKVTIKGDFGQPKVSAVRDGLKLCDLTLPLMNATMETAMGSLPLPKGAELRITTSLASIEAEIISTEESLHTVYINLKDENAAYNVNIDGMAKDQVAILETMLKKELQGYTGEEYSLGSFFLAKSLDPFVPQLVDFSFNLNQKSPSDSAFLLCCAFDKKGPTVENRLVFDSKILPNNLPAAIWVGKEFTWRNMIQPTVNESLKKDYPVANIVYDGDKTVKLQKPFSIGKPDKKHDADMQVFNLFPNGGNIKVHNQTKIYDITIFSIDAKATVDGHIAVKTSSDKTSFLTSSNVDNHKVETDGPSTFLQVVLGIITLGIIPIIIAVLEGIIKDQIGDAAGNTFTSKLKTATGKMNNVASKVPALQNLSVNGHLIFDDVVLQNTGSVCIGIKHTSSSS